MIIKVEISEETWARMLTGKRVEGTIGIDRLTGRKDFNAFNRQKRNRPKDRLIRKLPWGWVKESEENLKVFTSVPKVYGIENVLEYMDQDHEEAKVALIKHEMELLEFC